ncbi:DNA-binding protein [Rhodanobacter sp. AS-Z3]|uniref:DNA-binding protein n=1 Tax=Rhodanobacter sp. AS-Z3 TaxID=3031330 RepID=UPI00247AFB8F|nr:DNA-binding protein [Rhodanobacter sp. AS-Z3]WEN13791.1 DNA-binding protein [Rhodanobacter sp. AS-Z3]
MAKGITQDQVSAAADALVTAGDKPTVERIRAQLGTGSPNTVLRMLEVWRGTLAQRLQDVMQLPDMPPEVGQAATTLWRQALAQAETVARERLSRESAALTLAHAALADERTRWAATLENARAEVDGAVQARDQTQIRLDEQQRLITLLERQVDEHVRQRDLLQTQHETLHLDRDALRQRLEAFEATMANERAATVHHVRSVEDRAHAEVDRAREELKRQRQEANQRERQQQRELATITQRHQRAEGLRLDAERTIVGLTARLQAITSPTPKRSPSVRKASQAAGLVAAARKRAPSKEPSAKKRAPQGTAASD